MPTHAPATSAPPMAQLQRVRWSLITMFGLFGVVQTSWMGRLPSVRESLDITAGQLGTTLVVGAVGSLIGVTLTGPVIVRLGSRRTLEIGMVGTMVGFAVVGAGTVFGSMPMFSAGLLLNGLVVAATNVPVNLEAARVEKQLGKSILPHVHAAFSVGALVGSGVAATTSVFGVHVVWHIVGVAVVVTVGRALLIGPGTELADQPRRRAATPTADDADLRRVGRRSGNGSELRAWTERRTLLIGLVILAASMSEGAASNWLNLGVVDGFATREAVGAAAYGTFVVAMLGVRLFGAGLIDRFGRVAVLRASGASALLGLLAFGLSPSLPLAWVGIVLWGVGAAMAWPLGTAAAADDPAKAAARVSVVGSFGSIASLSVPPVLGLLADSWGVRHALLVITVAMVISLAAAGQVRPEKAPATAPAGHPEGAVVPVDVAPPAGAGPEESDPALLQERDERLDDAHVAVEPVDVEEPVGV